MSRENVEQLRTLYEGWAHGDFARGVEIYDPDVVWVLSDEFPNPGEYRGFEAMVDGFRDWLRAWTDWRLEAEKFIERGDRVVVLTRYRARGHDSGVVLDRPGAHVWTFDNGRAIRQEVWMDRQRALKAAGLRE